ncbi:TraB/GumN family protein [Dyadobacter subterraneus]|uniref:TraB/GumN family protein n=1 Tax=Dyadobacter subterraneus TaxID=2773304 RepID=A0ABR9WLF8_9BACT|nr:TraB/GumN family protein [Dyadobacter subterraneus]MBE9466346.1 TraB/GumN family protein [Dyadobacter subterraneus]
MKKITFLFFLLLLSPFSRAQSPVEKSLLWEISGKGITKPSYLFGTIHLICPADFSLSDSLKNAVSKTRQLALEIDMDDPGLMGAMTKTMFMADGKTLQGILTEKQYAQLSQFYKDSLGMNITSFGRAKPFMMMGPMFNKILGCEPQSYEISLMTLAAKQKSEIIGLETIEEQMAVFDTIPYNRQAEMLLSMIDKLPETKTEFHDLVELYKKQDLQSLYNLTLKSEFGMDGQDEVMLFQRNQNWIKRIDKIVHEKPTFIAVGAAHLGGEKGVIALLKKDGFKVRAVGK